MAIFHGLKRKLLTGFGEISEGQYHLSANDPIKGVKKLLKEVSEDVMSNYESYLKTKEFILKKGVN